MTVPVEKTKAQRAEQSGSSVVCSDSAGSDDKIPEAISDPVGDQLSWPVR